MGLGLGLGLGAGSRCVSRPLQLPFKQCTQQYRTAIPYLSSTVASVPVAFSILSSMSSRDIGELDGADIGADDGGVVGPDVVGAAVGENVSPVRVGVDVDGAVDGELLAGDVVGGPVGAAVSWQVPVWNTTREPTSNAQSKDGLLATLVVPVTVTKFENAAPSEASSGLA